MFIAHLLFFTAGQAGFIEYQENENQHKEYIQQFTDDKLQDSVDVAGRESGVLDKLNSIFMSIPIIGTIYELLFGPYMLIGNIELPFFIKSLITGILGIVELTSMIMLIRGVNV